MADIERISARIALRSARPRDLASLRDSLSALTALPATLPQTEFFAALAQALQPDPALHQLLSAAVLPEPSVVLREAG